MIPFIFFGTSRFSVIVLNMLKASGFLPKLIVTAPDRPKGRGLELTPSEVKIWAEKNNIEVLEPENLDSAFLLALRSANCTLFIVASYGKIIPKDVLDMATSGALNVHPSLLPKYRGASPLQSAILADDKNVGVTIMLMDEQMDHGPIVAQEKVEISWPPRVDYLEEILGERGGSLLAEILPDVAQHTITATPQNHGEATFTKKIKKEDGEITLDEKLSHENYLKFLAYIGWPGTYFFAEKNGRKIRVLIKDAHFENGVFTPTRVVPEGKKEMSYESFLKL
jgi:methionyl-tRNA formyltransferase